MSFSATYQPQVAVALTHISTVINSMRNGSVGVLIPKGRGQRVVARQHRPEITEGSEREEETKPVEEEQLDADTCMAILMQVDSIAKLSALMGVPESSHWKTTFVSAPTFFENKTGFTERMLEMPNAGGFSLFLKPEISRLLSQTLSPVYISRRGFKQERKQSAGRTGLGQTEESYLKFFTKSLGAQKQNWDQQTLHRILKDEKPHVQDKIKLAYAEGIMNSDGPIKDNSWSQRWKVIKNTVYVVLGLYLVYFFLFTRGGGSAAGPGGITGGIPGLGHTNFEVNPDEVHIKFQDVKGCDEAKEELANIVEFLKDKEKFEAVGAKLPKGVLMVGAPGVGKTLLAKAVAGEAGVPFYEASGSQFDDMFVGSGSRKVRQLFAAAKARAPSVIFIDEIDSVGAKRTNSQIHPYANQTVNQLLSEMDGFAGSSGVIVIGATNKKDNLDKALLRPGRFDMEVNVLLPDAKGREEIFKLYLSKVKSDTTEMDLKKLGWLSTGMTGADISNMVNQAALWAVLQGRSIVTMQDLDYARDKIKMGPAWKNKRIDEKSKWNTAYHEAGHALVAFYTEEAMRLHKVTILPRGQSLGHTSFMSTVEHGSTKAQMLANIDVSMGGRIGEELVYGKDQVTTGASNDFVVATNLATMMVKKFGMSDKVGQRVHNDPAMDGGSTFIQVNNLSPEMQQVLDLEINKILNEAYARAMNILKSHAKEHKLLAQALMKYETLDLDELRAAIEGVPIYRIVPEKQSAKSGSKNDTTENASAKPINDISGQ